MKPILTPDEGAAVLDIVRLSLSIKPGTMSSARAARCALIYLLGGWDGGDDGGADLTPDAVLARCRGVVKALCRKMVLKGDSRDDAFQEGCLRIVRRLPQYDPARASLTSWGHVIARSGILDFLRREMRAGRNIATDPDILSESQSGGDVTRDDVDRRERGHLQTDLAVKIARRLSRGRSRRQIAQELHCSTRCVQRIRQILRRHGVALPNVPPVED